MITPMRRLVMTALLGSWLAAAVGAAGGASPSGPTWPTCIPRTTPIAIGIKQVSRTRRGRLETLRLFSRAMGDVQPVDVLLPRRYDASGRTRYHVLYLLHGAGGDYRSWIETGAQRLIGGLPVIAVMPNGTQDGIDGDYTDWVLTAPGAPQPAPAWESFHIRELVPFIDSHFPTVASAAGRAIAGISMGGGGATKYAAEYPGTFGYVGTFSGESHPLLPVALAFQSKNCRWGSPATDQVIWRDNDSTDLAGNLRGVRVFIQHRNRAPGPIRRADAAGEPRSGRRSADSAADRVRRPPRKRIIPAGTARCRGARRRRTILSGISQLAVLAARHP